MFKKVWTGPLAVPLAPFMLVLSVALGASSVMALGLSGDPPAAAGPITQEVLDGPYAMALEYDGNRFIYFSVSHQAYPGDDDLFLFYHIANVTFSSPNPAMVIVNALKPKNCIATASWSNPTRNPVMVASIWPYLTATYTTQIRNTSGRNPPMERKGINVVWSSNNARATKADRM